MNTSDRKRGWQLLWFMGLLMLAGSGLAKEVILSFHSDIQLKQSGQIRVTETIRVQAENKKINRGIFRDFPTQYMGSWLTKKEVGFEVQSVFRDGQPEPFHTEKLRNGIRVFIGSADVLLAKGVHEYQLTYFTDRQLNYFEDHDEFYWNVTGNGWDFEILKASTSIQVPSGALDHVYDQQAWTGYQGEQHQHFTLNNSPQALGFGTTQQLEKYQGLTIGLSFPKGLFNSEPFDLAAFLAANVLWIMAVLIGLVYVVFGFSAWYRFGKDPEPGTIIARFKPPKSLSPAAVHFIENEGANDKTLTAAVLSLAVKGHVHIKQEQKSYQLTKKSSTTSLSKGEQTVLDRLFSSKNKSTRIKKDYNSKLSSAKSKLVTYLDKEFKQRCFKDNRFYVIWGWVISAVAFFIGTLLLYSNTLSAWDLVFVCFGFSLVLVFVLGFFLTMPILTSLVVLGVISMTFMDLYAIVLQHLPWLLFTLFLLAASFIFGYLMRAPTLYGRHLKDEIDGLKLYMKTAEEHRLNLMNPPEKNQEHFETLFPYALALGLENQWAAQFASLFNTDKVPSTNQGYQPDWFESHYQNSVSSVSLSGATRAMGRSMAAAAVKPSASGGSSYSSSSSYSSASSSYSSGGGSSGGGGGGGGGGGW